MKRPIYLDYAATTPVDLRVVEKMMSCLTLEGDFGNPASNTHAYGWKAAELVSNARNQVASLVNADPGEIVFTSGATEADNLAIIGAAHFYQRKGKHLITSKTEHKAVLDAFKFLESEGFEITYLTPEKNGLLDLEKLKAAIRDDTIFISIMHVNNEIGVIQDIKTIGEMAHEHEIIFHVDAAQSAGKIEIDLKTLPVDLMSFSGHKMYGPKGVGALFVRLQPRIRLEPQTHGGGHEKGLRSGTLATHQIVGMGEACRIAKEEMFQDAERVHRFKMRLWDGLKDMEEVYLNGDLLLSTPYILNVSFNYIEGESLMMAINDIAVSSGSACTSASLKPSYVLKALGLSDELAHSSIRFSFGRFTTENDIDHAIEIIHTNVKRLRDMSPLWEMYQKGIDINSVNWGES